MHKKVKVLGATVFGLLLLAACATLDQSDFLRSGGSKDAGFVEISWDQTRIDNGKGASTGSLNEASAACREWGFTGGAEQPMSQPEERCVSLRGMGCGRFVMSQKFRCLR
ncbi:MULTISPECIES: YecR family lipoprotein [unclassified Uliginosibacterium]|uniref:YecR family lipoprotein n=1 Tax=unclassified Uliginosibacterium TaxID=2621521 RepID=UPI000C7D0DA5|nr:MULTISPECIES: YecR family lipoprotein [unclassified Uliginosibacterium]MDO6388216.1 YecR family lipoprotein [Uliginosibacterium sp. 31-12]PLK50627.1 hypothetical protein C0V76_02090 [Uliginosibacterium sp. TH139]